MKSSSHKFARVKNIETVISELRMAAEDGDSRRVVTAAGELKSLLNFFKRTHGPFTNSNQVRPLVNTTGSPLNAPFDQNDPNFVKDMHALFHDKVLDSADNSWRGVNKQMSQGFVPNDVKNPSSINSQDTMDAMLNASNILGQGKLNNIVQKMLGDNQIQKLLDKQILRSTAINGKTGNAVTMRQILKEEFDIKDLNIINQQEFQKEIEAIATAFASNYKSAAVFNYMKRIAVMAIMTVVAAKSVTNIAIPAAAAATMDSPSSEARANAANPDAGGSKPINSVNTTPGHPHMTNQGSFDNLGGVSGAPSHLYDPNAPFSQRIVDYSSMYKGSQTSNNRLSVSQAHSDGDSIPDEATSYLHSIPSTEQYVLNIANIIKANGGENSEKAINEANHYVRHIMQLVSPVMKSIQ